MRAQLISFILLSVILAAEAAISCNRYSGWCSVSVCSISRNIHGAKYKPVKKSTCCVGSRRSVDDDCCRYYSSCYCGQKSDCYKSEHPATTTTAAPTTTTAPPTTMVATTFPPTIIATTDTTPAVKTTAGPTGVPVCQQKSGLRILNGRPVTNECTYKGIATVVVYQDDTNVPSQCHAVLANAEVKGKEDTAFVTTKGCLDLITAAPKFGLKAALKIGDKVVPVNDTTFEITEDGDTAYLKLEETFEFLLKDLDKCQEGVCAYNSDKMPSLNEFKDCIVASYGVKDAVSGEQKGLNEVDVIMTSNDCKGQDPKNLCFTAKSKLRSICTNDRAAPLFCTAETSNEKVFIGNVKSKDCDDANPAFEVIPVSKT